MHARSSDIQSEQSKLLILTRYGRSGASSRLRTFAYHRWLQQAGINVMVQPLHPDEYIKNLYAKGKRNGAGVLRSYGDRLRFLMTCGKVDLIWIEKELWPFMPFLFESILLRCKAPYVVDIDDAIFHNYDQHRFAVVRRSLGRKLDKLFQRAALVTAGSRYLEERARRAGAAWVERVPTVVDLQSYSPVLKAKGEVTVGWIGSPSTQKYLELVRPIMQDLASTGRCRFVTVGTSFPAPLFQGHEQQAWSEESEGRQVASFDIGIMPLPDTHFERGKCAYKLIQYMACGIPVVASPVGANCDVVRHGENGFLAATQQEWQKWISVLAQSSELRQRMGACGREDVEEKYSIQVMGPRVADLMHGVLRMTERAAALLRTRARADK